MSIGSVAGRFRVLELEKLIVEVSTAKKARWSGGSGAGTVTSNGWATRRRQVRQRERRALLADPHRDLRALMGDGRRVDDLADDAGAAAGRAGADVDDVEPAGDRLPSGGRQVDLLKHGRGEPPAHLAHRVLELLEPRADGRHVAFQLGPGGLFLPQRAEQVGGGTQAGQNQQEDERGPQSAPGHRVIFYTLMSVRVGGGRPALALGAMIAAAMLFGTVCSVDDAGLSNRPPTDGGAGGMKASGGAGGHAGARTAAHPAAAASGPAASSAPVARRPGRGARDRRHARHGRKRDGRRRERRRAARPVAVVSRAAAVVVPSERAALRARAARPGPGARRRWCGGWWYGGLGWYGGRRRNGGHGGCGRHGGRGWTGRGRGRGRASQLQGLSRPGRR